MQTKRIETYSLFEFCAAVQEAILQGWRFDLDSNENAPTAFGSMLVASMVKAEDSISTNTGLFKTDNTVNKPEDNTVDNIEVDKPKRGRPIK